MRLLLTSLAVASVLIQTTSGWTSERLHLKLAQAEPSQTAPAAPPPAAPPAAAPAPPPASAAAPAPTRLVGMQAWAQLVGNSITGQEDGKTLVEYYAADGTAKSMLGNEISTGGWALAGETVCFKYADDDKPECYRIEVLGTTATFTDAKGSGTRYEILKGNPKGL
jgi:hypothetical protein